MALVDHKPSLLSRFVRRIILWIYSAKGWRVDGGRPDLDRYVITAAPHTSNWDFVLFLGIAGTLRIRPHFMGKTSLFRWPMRHFMFDMGGVPVDRTKSQDYVAQMVDEFSRREDFILVIAPEGTRGGARKWKSGFYHIALASGVPIVPAYVDYSRKVGGLGPPLMPSGDYAADMARILDFYRDAVPNFPEPEL